MQPFAVRQPQLSHLVGLRAERDPVVGRDCRLEEQLGRRHLPGRRIGRR